MSHQNINEQLNNTNTLKEYDWLRRMLKKIIKRVERLYPEDGELLYWLLRCQNNIGWLISYARLIEEREREIDEFHPEDEDA